MILWLYEMQHPSKLHLVVQPRAHAAKIVLVPTLKTIAQQPVVVAQQKAAQQPVPKKVEQKKQTTVVAEKKVEPAKKPEQKIEQKKIAQKPAPKLVQKTMPPKAAPVKQEEQIIYVGRDDKIMLDLQDQLEQEIQKVWHPPVGIASTVHCALKVVIDHKGAVRTCGIEESSSVITYDIAARAALMNMKFPKQLWGKEVVITFKQ